MEINSLEVMLRKKLAAVEVKMYELDSDVQLMQTGMAPILHTLMQPCSHMSPHFRRRLQLILRSPLNGLTGGGGGGGDRKTINQIKIQFFFSTFFSTG